MEVIFLPQGAFGNAWRLLGLSLLGDEAAIGI